MTEPVEIIRYRVHPWFALFTIILTFAAMLFGVWVGKEVGRNDVTNLGKCHFVNIEQRLIGGWKLVADEGYYFYACTKTPEEKEVE